jgi:hypothetical protein
VSDVGSKSKELTRAAPVGLVRRAIRDADAHDNRVSDLERDWRDVQDLDIAQRPGRRTAQLALRAVSLSNEKMNRTNGRDTGE